MLWYSIPWAGRGAHGHVASGPGVACVLGGRQSRRLSRELFHSCTNSVTSWWMTYSAQASGRDFSRVASLPGRNQEEKPCRRPRNTRDSRRSTNEETVITVVEPLDCGPSVVRVREHRCCATSVRADVRYT